MKTAAGLPFCAPRVPPHPGADLPYRSHLIYLLLSIRPEKHNILVLAVCLRTIAYMATNETVDYSGYDPANMGRRFYKANSLNDLSAVSDNLLELSAKDRMNANLVSSLRGDGTHSPAFDLDKKAVLVASTTPGNHHMYIDEVLTWTQYKALLKGFYKAGLLDSSVYWRSLDRGATHVRPPWVRKTQEEYARGSIDSPVDNIKAKSALRRIKMRVILRGVLGRA